MAGETTIPLLPCGSIDDIADFYGVLGFHTTYRQQRPNPYVVLQREDLHLHFFGMPDFDPENSYGTCLVLVSDVAALYDAFAAGMRSSYGRVLMSGIPRMTRPRPKANQNGMTGFSVIDPGGNWIRVSERASTEPAGAARGTTVDTAPTQALPRVPAHAAAHAQEPEPTPAPQETAGHLASILRNAVVQGDSRGQYRQAAKILDGALGRPDATDDPVTLVTALVYRAEVAVALKDWTGARSALDRALRVDLTVEQRAQLAVTLYTATDIAANLS